MDENTDNWKTKVNNIEKNGTPLRSVFTTGRHFIENTYNSTLGSVSNGGFVSNFYGEGANSVTKSLESFKKNNKVSNCTCDVVIYWLLLFADCFFYITGVYRFLLSLPIYCCWSNYSCCCYSHL